MTDDIWHVTKTYIFLRPLGLLFKELICLWLAVFLVDTHTSFQGNSPEKCHTAKIFLQPIFFCNTSDGVQPHWKHVVLLGKNLVVQSNIWWENQEPEAIHMFFVLLDQILGRTMCKFCGIAVITNFGLACGMVGIRIHEPGTS